MRCYIVACLILAVFACNAERTSASLTNGEIDALAQILAAFPSLSHPQQDPALYDLMEGPCKTWANKALATVCGHNGFDVCGIHCSQGHIDGIVYSTAWGPMNTSQPLDKLQNLVYLHDFTVASFDVHEPRAKEDVVAFATFIFSNASLERVAVLTTDDLPPSFGLLVSQELTLKSLTWMPDAGLLEQVMLPLASSLRYLVVYRLSNMGSYSNMASFSNMTALENATFGYVIQIETLTLPPNLVSLTARAGGGLPTLVATGNKLTQLTWTGGTFVPAVSRVPASVKWLTYNSPSNFLGGSGLNFTFPPELETLELSLSFWRSDAVIDASIANCTNLKTLILSEGNLTHFIELLPSLLNVPITTLSMTNFDGGASIASETRLLCTLVDRTRLVSLSLMTGVTQLPNCSVSSPYPSLENFAAYSASGSSTTIAMLPLLPASLTSLNLVTIYDSKPPLDWDAFVAKFAVLQSLTLQNAAGIGTFPSQLTALSNTLSALDLSGNTLSSTIPEQFFANLNKLKDFRCSLCWLTGTFPSVGLQTLEYLDLSSTSLQEWPSPVNGAPNLRHVDFTMAQLKKIPDDHSFYYDMPSLEYLSLDDNSALNTSLPRFWGHHAKIEYVSMARCALTGPLPATITAPRLVSLSLSYNQLCGPLPEVPEPIGLKTMELDHNRLSGTWPSSWSNNLVVMKSLVLSNNLLNGTIPSSPLSTQYVRSMSTTVWSSFQIDNNYFSGPVPDLYSLESGVVVKLANTSLDLCERSPNFNPSTRGFCVLGNVSVDACNCPSYWQRTCRSSLDCSSGIIPANQTVVEPDEAMLVCEIPAETPYTPPFDPPQDLSPLPTPTLTPTSIVVTSSATTSALTTTASFRAVSAAFVVCVLMVGRVW